MASTGVLTLDYLYRRICICLIRHSIWGACAYHTTIERFLLCIFQASYTPVERPTRFVHYEDFAFGGYSSFRFVN